MSSFVINPYSFTKAFSPSDVSGLAIWLDAADDTTLFDATSGGSLPANNGSVHRWEDKSGNGRHFTRATSGRPTRVTSAVNSKDAVRFVGSQFIARTGGSFGASDLKNLFIVAQTADSTVYVWCANSTASEAYYDATGPAGASFNISGGLAGSVTGFRVNGAAFSGNRGALQTARGSSANIFAALGITATSAAWANFELNWRHGSNAEVSDGYCCELLIYGSTITTDERNSIERYLATKWGITI
jgi:hypothetical protein